MEDMFEDNLNDQQSETQDSPPVTKATVDGWWVVLGEDGREETVEAVTELDAIERFELFTKTEAIGSQPAERFPTKGDNVIIERTALDADGNPVQRLYRISHGSEIV